MGGILHPGDAVGIPAMTTTTTATVHLETVENTRWRFNGWNKDGEHTTDGSTGNAMMRRRCKYFRRNSDGVVFEVINSTETKALPPGTVQYVVGIRGAR